MNRSSATPARTHGYRQKLLAWFDAHKRDLPWRRTRDPYAIWVSEIMLQQTRVAAVLEHYANWMRRFPTVAALAAASEDEVLAAWSGLGYYRRARFLHKGAKAVVAEHNGRLPKTAAELRQLPGIGAYTSAAIASIAFGEAAAVVDGNVERVLLRQTGMAESGAVINRNGRPSLTAAEIQNLANQLVDPKRPGDFNQAMMELGATICLPRNPLCLQCPVQQSCKTRGEHPTPERKPSVTAEIAVVLIQRKRRGADEVLLQQRPATATVMSGMWELPAFPQNSSPQRQSRQAAHRPPPRHHADQLPRHGNILTRKDCQPPQSPSQPKVDQARRSRHPPAHRPRPKDLPSSRNAASPAIKRQTTGILPRPS